MQCTRILSDGLRTCKEPLNAPLRPLPRILSCRHNAAATLFWTGEEAGHGRPTEGAEFPRGNILISVSLVGQPHRIARNRIVQVDSPQTRSCKSQSDVQFRESRESRPFRHRLEDALGGGHFEHNLGLDLRLCAFRFHHLPQAIIHRREHERKPTEILHAQTRLGQGVASGCDQHEPFVKERDGGQLVVRDREEADAHIESIGEEASNDVCRGV